MKDQKELSLRLHSACRPHRTHRGPAGESFSCPSLSFSIPNRDNKILSAYTDTIFYCMEATVTAAANVC